MFLGVDEKFSHCKSIFCKKDEKYLKKVLASSEKGSTFAPAFGRNEGFGKKGDGKRKFFESLRPAQYTGGAGAPPGKGTFNKEHQENIKAEPEIQSKTEKRQ